MSENRTGSEQLSALLEDYAADFPVGPPPTIEGLTGVRRQRKSGWGIAAMAGGLVAVAALPVMLLLGNDDTGATPAPQQAAGATITASDDTQLFGLAQVVLEVPQEWAYNDLFCGKPAGDTVVFAPRVTPFCGARRPEEAESLEPFFGRPSALGPTRAVSVDGVAGEVEEVTCEEQGTTQVLCQATIWFPELEVGVHAASSTDAASVEEILDMVRVANNGVGIPRHDTPAGSPPPGSSGAHPATLSEYTAALERLGLKPRLEASPTGDVPPGHMAGTVPQAGTFVPLGSEVVVLVTTGPDGVLP